MNDAFGNLFQQMMEQGQEMARAFNPALENFKGADLDKLFGPPCRRT